MSHTIRNRVRGISLRSTPVQVTLFAIAYIASARLGYYLSFHPSDFATIWPPSGLFLAVLLSVPKRQWGWFIGAASVANILFNVAANQTPVAASIAFTLGNALEASAGAWLILSFCGDRITLRTARQVVGFALLGAVVATSLSAVVGAATVALAFGAPFGKSLLLWWISDGIGVIVVGPLVLVLLSNDARLRGEVQSPKSIEALLLLGSAALVSMAVAHVDPALFGAKYVAFPWLVWAAIRFGIRGAVIAFATIAIVSVWTATQFTPGDSHGLSLMARTLNLQGFLAVAGVTTMLLASIVEERHVEQHQRLLDANLLRAIFDGASDAIFMKDMQGRYEIVNHVAAHNIGMTPAAIVGKRDDALFPPAEAERIMAMDREIVASGQRVAHEHVITTGRSVRTFHTTKSPLHVNGVTVGVIGIARDVTERKLAESALREQARVLTQANIDLEQFAYIASHDLKAPLRGIGHLVEWIAEDLGDAAPANVARNLDRLRGRVLRIESRMESLLAYSRVGRAATEAQVVDTAQMVAEIADDLATRPGFVIESAGLLPILRTGRTPLDTVLRNLISNAIRHHDRDDGRVVVSAASHGAFVTFTVADDGPGIPLVHRERVFQMFQTLAPKSDGKGSGMGLALVRRLVYQAGGEIRIVQGTVERGATIEFTWPVEWLEEGNTFTPTDRSSSATRSTSSTDGRAVLGRHHDDALAADPHPAG